MLFAGECSVSLVERPSAQQCIPLHHEMSGYEGMISDILTVYLFLISLPCSSVEMIRASGHNPFTVLMKCLMFTAVTCMVICTFTNLNTNACDQKKLMLMIVLS